MKIALLSYEYPPETGFGGIGTFTWIQARALVKLGHEVHVLAGSVEPSPLRIEEHDGVRVHRFHRDGLLMWGARQLSRFGLWWTRNRMENALSMHSAFKKLHREHAYEVVGMPECGAEGALINNFIQATTIVRLHSPARLIMPYYPTTKLDRALCGRIEQSGLGKATAFCASSQYVADEARTALKIRRPIRVLPNGIDLDLFEATEQIDFRRTYELPEDRPIILFAGRMERRKGIDLCEEIITTILERHEAAFVFAGGDPFDFMAQTLQPRLQAKPFKGSFHYLGKLDFTHLHSGLCQSDIILIPSLWENCPHICLEAMAAGRAIVCSDQTGFPELIQDGENGVLARNGDAASYAAKLEELLEDGDRRNRLGAAARKTVEARYTDTYAAQHSLTFYQECLNSFSPNTGPGTRH
ncbi:MAG: glycosyltransferase family 4 protein [Verrucomicrobiota bacterium]